MPVALCQAQEARKPVISPEVGSDGRVTFRLDAPQAKAVFVEGDLLPQNLRRVPLTRGEDGVWSLTTAPLPADLYSYDFILDGVTLPDPANGRIKPGARSAQSMVLVPGEEAALVTLSTAVPHGEVRQMFYTSPVTHGVRRMHVYLPPDYAKGRKTYPAVYLFHGGGDNDTAWTSIGQVNVMLDTLIAQGKARPMIVVMPDLWADGGNKANASLFREDLLRGVIPFAQSRFRIAPGPQNRTVGGLGIGRAMLPDVVWPVLDRFGTVFFASGGAGPDHLAALAKAWPHALDRPEKTRFFLADGAQDGSLPDSLYLAVQLKARGFAVQAVQSQQAHGWPAFRRAFAAYAASTETRAASTGRVSGRNNRHTSARP